MKEVNPIINPEQGIHSEVKKQQEKEQKLIGMERRIPGLTVWEYDRKEKILSKAQFTKVDLQINSAADLPVDERIIRSRIDTKEGCLYFQALNQKNARRKMEKLGFFIDKSIK